MSKIFAYTFVVRLVMKLVVRLVIRLVVTLRCFAYAPTHSNESFRARRFIASEFKINSMNESMFVGN